MYVRKNTSQPGKCANIVSACTRLQLRQNACILAKSGFGNKLQPFLTVFYAFVVVPPILSRYTRVESKEKGGMTK